MAKTKKTKKTEAEQKQTEQHLIETAQQELQKRLAAEIARIFGQ